MLFLFTSGKEFQYNSNYSHNILRNKVQKKYCIVLSLRVLSLVLSASSGTQKQLNTKGYIISEQANRARHLQDNTFENRGCLFIITDVCL